MKRVKRVTHGDKYTSPDNGSGDTGEALGTYTNHGLSNLYKNFENTLARNMLQRFWIVNVRSIFESLAS